MDASPSREGRETNCTNTLQPCLPWAQGVAGSNPVAPTKILNVFDTFVNLANADRASADNWLTIGSVPTLLGPHSFTQSERSLHQRARLD